MNKLMTTPVVKTAMKSDEAGVIEALKLAFVADPAHYVENYSAAALWLPPEVHPDFNRMMALMQSSGSDDSTNDGPEVFERMSSYHPNEPHWYLTTTWS